MGPSRGLVTPSRVWVPAHQACWSCSRVRVLPSAVTAAGAPGVAVSAPAVARITTWASALCGAVPSGCPAAIRQACTSAAASRCPCGRASSPVADRARRSSTLLTSSAVGPWSRPRRCSGSSGALPVGVSRKVSVAWVARAEVPTGSASCAAWASSRSTSSAPSRGPWAASSPSSTAATSLSTVTSGGSPARPRAAASMTPADTVPASSRAAVRGSAVRAQLRRVSRNTVAPVRVTGCRPSSNSLPGGLFRHVIPWWPVT